MLKLWLSSSPSEWSTGGGVGDGTAASGCSASETNQKLLLLVILVLSVRNLYSCSWLYGAFPAVFFCLKQDLLQSCLYGIPVAWMCFLLTSGLQTNLLHIHNCCWISILCLSCSGGSSLTAWHLLQCSAVFFYLAISLCPVCAACPLIVLPDLPWRISNALGNSLLVVKKTLSL